MSVVKTIAGDETWWNEKTYIAEMDRRFGEMENGNLKGLSIGEAEKGTRQAYKNRKPKK